MKENNLSKTKIPSLWWRDAISKVIFLYVLFQFLSQGWGIYKAYTVTENPLVPEYLDNYAAFPHYFLAVYWALAVLLFYKLMKNTNVQENRFWILAVSTVVLLLGSVFLYIILMSVNPFG